MTEAAESEVVALTAETLCGDLTTWLVDRLKRLPKSWPELVEEEQRGYIQDAEIKVKSLIIRAVRLIAADGRATILATLDQITVKDGIKAVLSLSKTHEHRHALVDSQGSDVLIVVADSSAYLGGEAPKPTPDQADIETVAASDAGDTPLFDKTDMGKAA